MSDNELCRLTAERLGWTDIIAGRVVRMQGQPPGTKQGLVPLPYWTSDLNAAWPLWQELFRAAGYDALTVAMLAVKDAATAARHIVVCWLTWKDAQET